MNYLMYRIRINGVSRNVEENASREVKFYIQNIYDKQINI